MVRPVHVVAIVALATVVPPASVRADDPTAFVEPLNPAGVRAIGLGGAFVGLADDSSSTILNPAGLSKVPRSLEGLGAIGFSGGARPHGVSAGLRPGRWWAVGLQWAGPATVSAHPGVSSPSATLPPSTDASVSDYALGAAATIGSHNELSAGASLRLSHLSVPGISGKGDNDTSFTAGVLFRPVNPWSPRLGLSYRHKSDWELKDPAGATHHVRGVSVVSAGASWHYEPQHWFRLLVTLQPDLVLYSQLDGDRAGTAGARNDVDLRTGVEATIPFHCYTGCGSMVQLRVGLLNSAALPVVAQSPSGDEGSSGAVRRVTKWSVGAAIALRSVFHGRLKFEAAYDWRTETLAVGFGYRFPEAFRAEIVDTTRR